MSGNNSWLEHCHERTRGSLQLIFLCRDQTWELSPRSTSTLFAWAEGAMDGHSNSSGSMSNRVIAPLCTAAWLWTVVGWFVCVRHIITYTHMLICIPTFISIGHLHKHALPYSHLCKREITHEQCKHVCTHKHAFIHRILAFFRQ